MKNTLNIESKSQAAYLPQSIDESVRAKIKQGIWLYFILLVFEGALRKWVLPSLSNPLLIVRDPVAIWIIFLAWKHSIIKENNYVMIMSLITFIAIVTSLLFGHHNIIVVLYGARITLIHFPLLFVIGQVFNRNDVIKLGKVTLWIALPMVVLLGIQFYSPQSAWVNRGIGGNMEGAGFSGAMGYLRPPGTFSFTSGNSLFWGFVSAFTFYFWIQDTNANRWLLLLASAALFGAMSFSISRTLFFQICVTAIFALFATSQNSKIFGRLLIAILGVCFVLIIMSQISIFSTGIEAFTDRFTSANENEGGIKGVFLDRFLGGMLGALSEQGNLPFWGYGLGMGTNAGAQILSGSITFLISEGEWGRVIGESGALLGISMVLIRLTVCFDLLRKTIQNVKVNNTLPLLLLSFGLLNILQGQWAQPTSLGFSVLTGGLILASLNKE